MSKIQKFKNNKQYTQYIEGANIQKEKKKGGKGG